MKQKVKKTKKNKVQKKYNSNLAAEYFVLSMLYRLGANAYLTLGNKKAVDIIVEKGKNSITTIDVKGLAGITCWGMDNFRHAEENHFIVLVSFKGKIHNCETVPEVYIIPSTKVKRLLYENPKKSRKTIKLSTMRKEKCKKEFKDKWEYFTN